MPPGPAPVLWWLRPPGIVRGMRLPILLLLVLVVLPGCGLSEQDRPVLVSTWPAQGQVVPGPISFIRCTYNEPVTILNPFDVRLYINSGLNTIRVTRDPDDPNSILVYPPTGTIWATGATYSISLIQGAVINAAEHYSPVPFAFNFNVAPASPSPVTRPGQVTLFSTNLLTAVGSTPTPAGREPVLALRTQLAGVSRIWAQLDSGGGTGEALAWYTPGDGVMTPVALSTAGGDLTATSGALIAGRASDFVYAAYRDESSDRIRLVKVSTTTGMEVSSLVLESVAASAMTRPTGMVLHESRPTAYISAEDGATGTVAYVDLETFTEIDLDEDAAGIQGITLDSGAAGPISQAGDVITVGLAGGNDITTVRIGSSLVATNTTSTVVGTSFDLLRTVDRNALFQPLRGYADDMAIVRRYIGTQFTDPAGIMISDDIGGVSTNATDAVAMQRIAASTDYILLLDTPAGLILTLWTQSGISLIQQDLDDTTDGIQALDVEAQLSGATSIGQVFGTSAP